MASVLIGLTIALPWIGAVCVWLAQKQTPRASEMLAYGFSIAAACASFALIPFTTNTVALRIPIGGAFGDFTFVPDGLGILLACIATGIGSLAVLFSFDYMRGEKQRARYYALILIFIGSMAGLVLTSSLFLLVIFWEMVAFCSYALISFHNDDPKAVAGGIKALAITQIGGIGLVIGVLLAYAQLGSYSFDTFLRNAPNMPREILAVIAFGFLIAAAAKSAQVPFHTWLPDAMEAPTPVSALIHAATMVNAGIYLLARFFPAFVIVPNWANIVVILGVLSALLGAALAVVTNDLKRVLAYSTISQLGYMVTAIGIGALFAGEFHLLSHAVFKALLFFGAGAVIHTIGTRDLYKMGGLNKPMPFTRNAFIIGALALVGLPILNGFWSKELVLEACATCGQDWVFIALVATVGITALYTFRMVWLVFFGDLTSARPAHDATAAMRVVLGVLSFATLTTWLFVGPLSCWLVASPLAAEMYLSQTAQVCRQVLAAPSTLVALSVTAAGFAAWWWGKNWIEKLSANGWVRAVTTNEFGFEWLNARIVTLTLRAANTLRATQTGQLNWNVVGIASGLILVFVILVSSR